MEYQQLVVIVALVLFGIPLSVLIFFVCRRLHEMHKLSKTRGTVYVSEDGGVYLELDDDKAFEQRVLVLRVKKLKPRGGKENV